MKYDWLNKLEIGSTIKTIFYEDGLENIESQNLRTLFKSKLEFEDNTKIHLCKLSNEKPKELMAVCSVTNDIDEYFENYGIGSTKLEKSLENLIIIFLDENNQTDFFDFIYKGYVILNKQKQIIDELESEVLSIIEELKNAIYTNNLEPVYRENIIFKIKDSKPYKEIYSEKFGRIISEKRYGWYFSKKILIDCYNLIENSESGDCVEPIDYNYKKENFYDLLSQLKTSDNSSVTKLEDDKTLFDDLYIEREIELDLKEKIINVQGKQLILLVGNSGDGKSTILRKLLKSDELQNNGFEIHNDATESFYPNKDSIETLMEVLEPYSDQNLEEGNKKVLIAINMGIIGKFLDHPRICEFSKLKEYLLKSNILKDGVRKGEVFDKIFDYFSFSEYFIYNVSENDFNSRYIELLFDSVFSKKNGNIFYENYLLLDNSIKNSCPVAINYELMTHKNFQDYIKNLLILVHIDDGILLTSRILWNFIFELLFDEELERLYSKSLKPLNGMDFVKRLLPNKLFNVESDNEIIKAISNHSDLVESSYKFDLFLHQIFTCTSEQLKNELMKTKKYNNQKIIEESIELIYTDNYKKDENFKYDTNRMLATIFAVDYGDLSVFDLLHKYARIVYIYNKSKKLRKEEELKVLKENISTVICSWNGKHNKENFINTSFTNGKFKKSVKFDSSKLKFKRDDITICSHFYKLPRITYKEEISLLIDYNLFCIINKIINGYQLNSLERMDYIRLNDFITNLVYECINEKEQYIYNGESSFVITLNEYDEFIIRKD